MTKGKKKLSEKTERLAGLGILTAIIIVLQIISTFVKFGPFSITLSLIPIIVGAAIYGAGAGAYLGAVFSAVVVIMCISGGDPGGAMVWNANPFVCFVLCMLKGTLAGFEAGIHYTALESKNRIAASVSAAFISPIVNTGVFLIGLIMFFKDTLRAWAGGTDVLYYIIFGLTGLNFIIELSVNVVLCPVIVRVIQIVKKGK